MLSCTVRQRHAFGLGTIRTALAPAGVAIALQRVTGLARSTLSTRVDALLAAGYLTEDGSVTDPRRGRPSTRLRVNDQAATVLVADLGATHGRLAVSTAEGEVINETVIESAIEKGRARFLTR